MNLWLRLIALLLSCLWRSRLQAPLDASRLAFRVWPHDLDTSLHMNNGRYWTLMDLGRVDLVLRSGLWKVVLRRRWTPVVSAAEIRFRRELRAFQRFSLETRILGWTETHMIMEHRMTTADGVAAMGLVMAAMYERGARRFVPMREMLAAVGVEQESPPLGPEVLAFLKAEEALREITAPGKPEEHAPGVSDVA